MEGGCFCGALRYRISGTPQRVTHCHCTHCRRTTGAPFVTWVETAVGSFELIQGTPERYATRPGVTRQFCGRCGTQITFEDAEAGGGLDVTAASLDAPEELEPDDHVWCDRMLRWVKMDDGLPRFRTRRNPRE